MFPVLINSPFIEWPLSGDVTQDIAPSFFAQMVGVPEIEHRIVTEVAGYGKQLGRITEAVLAIADAEGVSDPKVEALRALAERIEAEKPKAKEAVRARAEKALEDLRRVDEPAWRALRGG